MKFFNRIVVSFVACCAATTAFGWGMEGHETIGAMADKLIAGTPAAAHVHELLGDETLSTASVWADQVKSHSNQTPEMLQFKNDNPHHYVFHYTDIPFEEKAYRDDSIGATNVDVVHAIPACILILQGKAGEQTLFKNVSPKVALCLLVHYIEDIHQPLHVGSGYLDGTKFVNPNGYGKPLPDDKGANQLVFGGTNKLHFFWDVTVVQLAMTNAKAQTPAQYADFLLTKPAPAWKSSGPLLSWDRYWANESLALSAQVHGVVVTNEIAGDKPVWQIKKLNLPYMDWAARTAEKQMTKAGYRVAGTLEAIWPN